MRLILSDEELENVIHTSLCNGLGTGYMDGYGLMVDEKALNYDKYRAAGDYYEDVILKALKAGETFHMIDLEGDGDNSSSFTLAEARERLSVESIAMDIITVLNEQDDVCNADSILQTALYGEVIFG